LTTDDKVPSLVKENSSVGRTHTADLEEEAAWDSFVGVVWVERCFEEVLMFVCGLCMEKQIFLTSYIDFLFIFGECVDNCKKNLFL